MKHVEYSHIKEVGNDWTQLPDSQKNYCNQLLTQMPRISTSILYLIRSAFTSAYLVNECFIKQFLPTNTSYCSLTTSLHQEWILGKSVNRKMAPLSMNS